MSTPMKIVRMDGLPTSDARWRYCLFIYLKFSVSYLFIFIYIISVSTLLMLLFSTLKDKYIVMGRIYSYVPLTLGPYCPLSEFSNVLLLYSDTLRTI